jgi:hypothetical protein
MPGTFPLNPSIPKPFWTSSWSNCYLVRFKDFGACRKACRLLLDDILCFLLHYYFAAPVGFDPTSLVFQTSASTRLASEPNVDAVGLEPTFSTNYLYGRYKLPGIRIEINNMSKTKYNMSGRQELNLLTDDPKSPALKP